MGVEASHGVHQVRNVVKMSPWKIVHFGGMTFFPIFLILLLFLFFFFRGVAVLADRYIRIHVVVAVAFAPTVASAAAHLVEILVAAIVVSAAAYHLDHSPSGILLASIFAPSAETSPMEPSLSTRPGVAPCMPWWREEAEEDGEDRGLHGKYSTVKKILTKLLETNRTVVSGAQCAQKICE